MGAGVSGQRSGGAASNKQIEQGRSNPAVLEFDPVVGYANRFYGLQNFGNTCYANSVLQALYGCVPFRRRVLEYFHIHGSGKKSKETDSILLCLGFLYNRIAHNKRASGVIEPLVFIQKMKQLNPQFQGHMHQDAHEFLSFLLNELASDLRKDMASAQEEEEKRREKEQRKKRKRKKPKGSSLKDDQGEATAATCADSNSSSSAHTWVQDIFEGTLTNETQCMW